MAKKLEISRIQNRRGLRRDLPQPLNAGEMGLCLDTAQIFIGASADQSLLAVAPGVELYRPTPAGGQGTANTLLQRVLLGDTYALKTGVNTEAGSEDDGSDVVSLQEVKEAILGKGKYLNQGMYGEDSEGRPGYRIDTDASDLYDVIQLEDLDPGITTGLHRYRVFVGVYETDLDGVNIEINYLDDVPSDAMAEVRLNLLNTKFDMSKVYTDEGELTEEMLGELPHLFSYKGGSPVPPTQAPDDDISNTPVIGSFIDGQLKDATWKGKSNAEPPEQLALDVAEYGNIAWCMNQIYSLGDEGLVVSTNNIQIMTELSLIDLINPDLTLIRSFTDIDLGVSNLNAQNFFLDLTTERAFKFNYSLSINTTVGSDITEENIGEGQIDISVFVDKDNLSNSKLTFRDEQSFLNDDMNVRLIPYLGDSPLSAGQIAVLFQTENQTGKVVQMRVNGIQWKAFNV